ncbi:PqqD family protein [candidate division CSSED10-310 bacterium]|uniref:PqqD family protein n=1 Tax=candidate division CSSED10-310 bacterium TaxID=2855610 RepID=A0ABV6YRS3_UNCC1
MSMNNNAVDKDFMNKVYQKSEQVISRKIAGEVIIVPIRGNLADMQRIFSLNPVAEYIWQHLDGEMQIEELQQRVIDYFDVSEEQATLDLHEFVVQLLEANLISEVSKS